MIVEDQFDRGIGRVRRIEKLEELNELATAMAILHQGMDLTREEVDAGQETERAVALVLIVTGKARKYARLGRQIRRRGGDRLDAGLLIIRDDHHRLVRFLGC